MPKARHRAVIAGLGAGLAVVAGILVSRELNNLAGVMAAMAVGLSTIAVMETIVGESDSVNPTADAPPPSPHRRVEDLRIRIVVATGMSLFGCILIWALMIQRSYIIDPDSRGNPLPDADAIVDVTAWVSGASLWQLREDCFAELRGLFDHPVPVDKKTCAVWATLTFKTSEGDSTDVTLWIDVVAEADVDEFVFFTIGSRSTILPHHSTTYGFSEPRTFDWFCGSMSGWRIDEEQQ